VSQEPTGLLSNVLLPVANAADARTTAGALEPYQPEHVIALHVVEKGEGVPDKTPVEQSEAVASEAFSAVREVFPSADDRIVYRKRVVAAIVEVSDEVDASAIVFCPQESGRLTKLLSGDRSLQLVTTATRPVIALPRGADRPK